MSLRSLESDGAQAIVPSDRTGPLARQAGLLALQVGVGLALLGAWQLASGRLIDPFFISSPVEVGARLWRWARSGSLLFHLGYTLYAMVIGFLVGALVGFAVGFLFGRSARTAAVFDPYITALYCVPKIALAPLFIMWFGIGIESKIAMSAIIVFFLVFLNTFSGVREVNPLYLHALAIMGASRWQLLRYAIVPSAMSWVLTGLKISVPYALIGTVVGEFMSSNRGIGFLIAQASGIFDTAGVFAGLVVLAVVGALLNAGLKRVERHLLRWRTPA